MDGGEVRARAVELAVCGAVKSGGKSGEEVLRLAEARYVPVALLGHGWEGEWEPDLDRGHVADPFCCSLLLSAGLWCF